MPNRPAAEQRAQALLDAPWHEMADAAQLGIRAYERTAPAPISFFQPPADAQHRPVIPFEPERARFRSDGALAAVEEPGPLDPVQSPRGVDVHPERWLEPVGREELEQPVAVIVAEECKLNQPLGLAVMPESVVCFQERWYHCCNHRGTPVIGRNPHAPTPDRIGLDGLVDASFRMCVGLR